MNKVEYKDLIAFHPGYYLADIIEEMGITQQEFAHRLGTTGKNLSDLLRGKIRLSDEIALKLSLMLGTSTDLWLNLQKTYTEKTLEIERNTRIDQETRLLQQLDYGFFYSLNLVPEAKKNDEKVEELLKYLNVSSFNVLKETDFLINFRTSVSQVEEKNIINSNAWVLTALNMGRNIKTDPLDLKRLKGFLPEIRSMTRQHPEENEERLVNLFSSCGVAFVLVPHLKNSGINGAVKWISKQKVILAINDRRKYADSFWFSLFHEIGHVFQQKATMLIVNRDINEMDETNKKLERMADDFAQNALIPKEEYERFLKGEDYSEYAILSFSDKISIHPGIVVGRMQRDGYLDYNSGLNRLKEKYTIGR